MGEGRDTLARPTACIVPADDTLGARFALGVISNKTDPAEVPSPRPMPNVQNEISEKEQSLLVKYDDIEPGHRSGSSNDSRERGSTSSSTTTSTSSFTRTRSIPISSTSSASPSTASPTTRSRSRSRRSSSASDNWCQALHQSGRPHRAQARLPGRRRDRDRDGDGTSPIPEVVYTVRMKGLPTAFQRAVSLRRASQQERGPDGERRDLGQRHLPGKPEQGCRYRRSA